VRGRETGTERVIERLSESIIIIREETILRKKKKAKKRRERVCEREEGERRTKRQKESVCACE